MGTKLPGSGDAWCTGSSFSNVSSIVSASDMTRSPEPCGKSWRNPFGSCPNSKQKCQPRPTAKERGREEGGRGGRLRGGWPKAHAALQFHVHPLHHQPVSMGTGQGLPPLCGGSREWEIDLLSTSPQELRTGPSCFTHRRLQLVIIHCPGKDLFLS